MKHDKKMPFDRDSLKELFNCILTVKGVESKQLGQRITLVF